MTETRTEHRLKTTLRWTASAASVALLGFFVFMYAAHRPDWSEFTQEETGCMVGVIVMCIGTALTLRHVVLGAIVVFCGYVAFCWFDGDLNLDNPFVLFPSLALVQLFVRAL